MFALTLARSYRSPWAGVFIALGHAVIEVPLIMLIYFGFSELFQKSVTQMILSLAGGAMVIWMGIDLFRTRNRVSSTENEVKGTAFKAGIIMSGLNPFFLLWWATVGSMLISRFVGYGVTGMTAFTLAHWSCDLIWLSFVSAFVYKTHAFWGKRVQELIFIACSALLVGFGGYFLISGIKLIA